ncbi:pyridoxal-phosphate dependent enzyme [Roseovarius sp. C7]|uniref:pyridoxal-phosphate dependent enzyme n=1 Tax=Roseovarius sp. C7 TaxID=3398643 RepID=UPI0039F676CE
MKFLKNPYRGAGLELPELDDIPAPSVDAAAARGLMAAYLPSEPTPLTRVEAFGADVWIKDESGRMGLGSFKALGAAYVIAHMAQARGGAQSTALAGETFITSSAGNHGLSLAYGAARFGARAVIYMSKEVPSGFAARLRAQGAEVVIEGDDYEASMVAAKRAADENGWTLLLDTSWPGYWELPHRLMEGYLAMGAEIVDQLGEVPTHVFLQAGVGGLAGAMAAYMRHVWGDAPKIIVVEPNRAAALFGAIDAGRVVTAEGGTSDMGRLDCKEASLIALKGLARDADAFALISEEEAFAVMDELAALGFETTTSGAAGLAALAQMSLPDGARPLCILSEGAG